MKEIIMVDEKTRIYHMDSLNWTVQTYREVKKKDGPSEMQWVNANGPYGPFSGRPDSPVIVGCLLDNSPELDGFDGMLAEYTKAMNKASTRIAMAIRELNR